MFWLGLVMFPFQMTRDCMPPNVRYSARSTLEL